MPSVSSIAVSLVRTETTPMREAQGGNMPCASSSLQKSTSEHWGARACSAFH